METNKKDLNADNQDIAASLNNLGLAYNDQGEYKKAIDHYNKSREIMNHSLPPIHPDVAVLLNNSGLAFDEQGEYKKAVEKYEESLYTMNQSLEKMKQNIEQTEQTNLDIATIKNNLGLAHFELGQIKEAKECHQKSLDIINASQTINHSYHITKANALDGLGNIFRETGEPITAINNHEQSIEIKKKYLENIIQVYQRRIPI